MKSLSSIALLAAVICFAPAFSHAVEPHDAIRPVPRTGGWMTRHESFNARVAKGNVDLIFIGDSITQGWEGKGRMVWEKYYGNRNAVNLGIGGDRTQHVIWRLDNGNIKDISPEVAVIMIGTNNSGSNFLEEDGTLTREIMPDLLHLSEKGYAIWAESIEGKLSELMTETSN